MSTDTQIQKKFKISKAKKYGIVFHNNNVTTMENVMLVITWVFKLSEKEAYNKTIEIHEKGKSVVYSNSKELCDTKLEEVQVTLDKINEKNLKVTVEEI